MHTSQKELPKFLSLIIFMSMHFSVLASSCDVEIKKLDRIIKNQYVERDWTNFWACTILLNMKLKKDAQYTQHQISILSESRRLAVKLKNDSQNRLCEEAIENAIRKTTPKS